MELPSGRGLADLVYIPEKNSPLPGVVIELKWDESAEGAIKQIKDRKYPAILRVNHYFYVIPDRGTTANLNS